MPEPTMNMLRPVTPLLGKIKKHYKGYKKYMNVTKRSGNQGTLYSAFGESLLEFANFRKTLRKNTVAWSPGVRARHKGQRLRSASMVASIKDSNTRSVNRGRRRRIKGKVLNKLTLGRTNKRFSGPIPRKRKYDVRKDSDFTLTRRGG